MEALQSLIPFLGVILGIFIGYFLNQALYEKKRRDELADREFARRTIEHDARIQEVKDYVEKWNSYIALSLEVFRVIGNEPNLKTVNKALESYKEEIFNAPQLMIETRKQMSTIDRLNDEELTKLQIELFQNVQPPIKRFSTLDGDLFRTGEKAEDAFKLAEIRRILDWEESRKLLREGEKIITKIKIRLDKLAAELK